MLETLTEEVLQFTRIENGLTHRQEEEIALDDMLHRCMRVAGPQASRENISLHHDIPVSLLLRCDPTLMGRAIGNLITNSIRYSPEGSSVLVAARLSRGECVISVSDQGCGIPIDEQEKVWEPYMRSRLTQHEKTGTGLGLPLVRQIMQIHDGRSWLTSTVGQGTIVRLCLPANRVRMNPHEHDAPDRHASEHQRAA